MPTNKIRHITPCKFYSGVCGASNRGFSHDHHVLPDADDHRNPLPKSASQRYGQFIENINDYIIN